MSAISFDAKGGRYLSGEAPANSSGHDRLGAATSGGRASQAQHFDVLEREHLEQIRRERFGSDEIQDHGTRSRGAWGRQNERYPVRTQVTRRSRSSRRSGHRDLAALFTARLVVFALFLTMSFVVSSLAGEVFAEQARQEGIRAHRRSAIASGAEAQLRHEVDSLTSLASIRSWAEERGFQPPAVPATRDSDHAGAVRSGEVHAKVATRGSGRRTRLQKGVKRDAPSI